MQTLATAPKCTKGEWGGEYRSLLSGQREVKVAGISNLKD